MTAEAPETPDTDEPSNFRVLDPIEVPQARQRAREDYERVTKAQGFDVPEQLVERWYGDK